MAIVLHHSRTQANKRRLRALLACHLLERTRRNRGVCRKCRRQRHACPSLIDPKGRARPATASRKSAATRAIRTHAEVLVYEITIGVSGKVTDVRLVKPVDRRVVGSSPLPTAGSSGQVSNLCQLIFKNYKPDKYSFEGITAYAIVSLVGGCSSSAETDVDILSADELNERRR